MDNKLEDGPAEELCHFVSFLNQQDVQTVKSLKFGREWLVDLVSGPHKAEQRGLFLWPLTA